MVPSTRGLLGDGAMAMVISPMIFDWHLFCLCLGEDRVVSGCCYGYDLVGLWMHLLQLCLNTNMATVYSSSTGSSFYCVFIFAW